MAFKPFQNYRATPTVTASPEDFTITSGVALLAEAPADPATYAMTVTVGGNARTRVTGTPAAGQYRVKVSAVIDSGNATHVEYLPILEFHSSDEGLAGTASYYQTGSIFTAEWASSLVTFLKPQYGLASAGDLPAVTTDVLSRGGPGDLAFLSSGAMYVSDGTQWIAAAGGMGAKVTVTKTVSAAALVQTSYTATVSSDAFVNLTASQVNVDVTADALAQEQGKTATVSADGYVDAMHLTATITADAAVAATGTATATADAALQFAATATVSADASVSTSTLVRTDSFDSLSGYAAYSSSSPYTLGDIIHLNNTLYICRQSFSGATSPTGGSGSNFWDGYMGANWSPSRGTIASQAYGCGVDQSTGRVGSQTSGRMSYWSADTFNTSQYAQITPAAFYTSSTRGACPAVRVAAATETGYYAIASTTTVYLYKCVAGSASSVATYARSQSAGDVLRIEATGTGATVSLVVKVNGTSVITYDDTASDRITSGAPGVRIAGANQASYQGDSWEGGDL